MDSFLSFWSENVRKVPKMSYFMQFWPILGPYDPLKGPLHYQESTFKGPYSPNSLNILVLPEVWFISSFLKWKCSKVPKITNFMQFWPISGPYDPLKSTLHYQQSIWISTTRKLIYFYHFWRESVRKVPKISYFHLLKVKMFKSA